MSEHFDLDIQSRPNRQTAGELRKMRSEGRVPAILYGSNQENILLSVCQKKLEKALEKKSFRTAVFSIEIQGKMEKIHPRDVQYHKLKNTPIHLDLMRV